MAKKAAKKKTRSTKKPTTAKSPKRRSTAARARKSGPVADKIVDMAGDVIKFAHRREDPFVDIPVRALSNVSFNARRRIIEMGANTQRRAFFNLGQAKRFMQTLLVASGCKRLLDQRKTTSIRDLFYNCKHTIAGSSENTFDEQDESDPIIEDLEVALDSLREELGLFADPKGAMVGPITIVDTGDTIDLSHLGSGGWAVPSIVEDSVIQFKSHKAKFVLLIEKAAVWRRFNEDRFWQQHKCIILHGGGQPPRGVRRLLYRLHHELKLPVYVLVDNDPWGYYIYSVVKQGSINLAYESRRMAVPAARFVGMSSFDAERYDIPPAVAIKLNDRDVARAKEIARYPWFDKRPWQREIKHMLKCGVKLELEALSNKDFSFVTETYLPQKLRRREWID